MDITMGMIYDGLSSRLHCEKGRFYNPDETIERILLIEGDYTPELAPGTCFIADSQMRRFAPGVPLERLIAVAKRGGGKEHCAIAVLCDMSSLALYNAVSESIGAYETWADDLLDLAVHGAGLDDLVDCAHGLLGNPITVIDQNYRILAQTDDDSLPDEQWVNRNAGAFEEFQNAPQGLHAGGFESYLKALETDGFIFGHVTHTGIALDAFAVKRDPSSLIAVNLIMKNRQTTDGNRACLAYLTSVLAVKMHMVELTWQNKQGSYIALLNDVLRGNISERGEFKARLERDWIKVSPYFTVLMIAAGGRLLKHHQLCRIQDDISAMYPEGVGVIHERKLVLFMNHESQDIPREYWKTLEEYAKDRGLTVAVSETRGDDCSLNTLVKQTQFALHVRDRHCSEETLAFFSDYRRMYLLDICSLDPNWKRYLHPCVQKIIANDVQGGVPLLETLRCLMGNYGNRKQTAQQLNIQRNTLQYRIEKIESLCGIDLTDPDTFDHIVFSVGLLEYCADSTELKMLV